MPESPDKDHLQALLRRAVQGEEGAWRCIVESYGPRVFALIRAHCGNDDLAEEITQSTFCTIVVKIESYTELGRFESWLFRIAMNRLRDEMRRQKRQARPVGEEVFHGLAGEEPEDGVPGEEGDAPFSVLNSALGQLSDADRRIIHLRHHAELSFKQIADVLGQPLGTVLARHHRALKKLRDLLGPGYGAGS